MLRTTGSGRWASRSLTTSCGNESGHFYHLPSPSIQVPGPRPVPNRAALTGIVFVLKTGIRWRDLPAEMGCGLGVSCWRRLRDWQEAGVWDALHASLLTKLRAANQIDFSRVVVDSSSITPVGSSAPT